MPSLLVCISLMATHEAMTGDRVIIANLIPYVQMAYWVTVWYAAQVWIRDGSNARTVLKGLMTGAVITAASVCYAYMAGVDNSVYEIEGVKASSGFFVSGKGIAGTLVVGGLTAAYLGIARRPWRYAFAAVFCFGACVLTYARAGFVALCLTLLWLVIWATLFHFHSEGRWVRRLVVVACVGAALLITNIGVTDLSRRWSDLKDPNRAGSGRLQIWAAAAESFSQATVTEQFAGRGYEGMVDVIEGKIGNRIHTHNDVLDMLVMGGMMGIVVLLLVFGTLAAQIVRAPTRCPEFAAAAAVLLGCVCQAILTGQLFMPDVMTYYVLAITALLVSTAPVIPNRRRFPVLGSREWPVSQRV
jgi:O-antigen ligase